MLIILHGEDNFRSRTKLKEIIDAYQKKHNFLLEKFHAQDLDFREFKSAFEGQSLFDSSKLIVLEDLFKNPQLLEQVEDYLVRGSDPLRGSDPPVPGREAGHGSALSRTSTTLVLYETSSISQNKDYKKLLQLASKKQEFKKLSAAESSKWFVTFFNQNNVNIEQSIAREVFELCQKDPRQEVGGASMWQTYNELNKLYTYKFEKQVIKKDLEALNIGSAETQIFPTIDAIFRGNSDKAFLNILLHWQKGEYPQYLFSMIERQLRILALVKEASGSDSEKRESDPRSLAVKLGLHPFVVQKTLPLSSKFSWDIIKALYARVESLDIKSKSGQVNPYLACELLSAAILTS